MKKIIFMFIAVFLMFITVDNVFATCYKVRDTHTGKVRYTTAAKFESSETAESVADIKCSILSDKVMCGNIGTFNRKIPEITSWIVTIIEIVVPVILTIIGAIDFVKAIISSKEDEIKKGQQVFIRRLITAVIIFFIVAITKLIVSVVSSGSTESKNIINCIDCFISNKCS